MRQPLAERPGRRDGKARKPGDLPPIQSPIALVERGLGMHKPLAALVVAVISVLVTAPASATPAQVNVRIEGKTETLFEGPILTDGHNVKGLTDTKAPAWGRRCN